jgi:hypothetical protein
MLSSSSRILELLANAGASASTYYVNKNTGEKVSLNALPGTLARLLSGSERGSAERILVLVKAGYIPSEEELESVSHQAARSTNKIAEEEMKFFSDSMKILDMSSKRCKTEYESSHTVDELEKFIQKFKANDSCNQVSRAKAKLSGLVAQEKIWRKNLSIGEQTNCGLVTAVNGRLVKVQVGTANVEQWLAREDMRPRGYLCPLVSAKKADESTSPKDVGDTRTTSTDNPCPALRQDQIQKMEDFISQFEANCRATGGRVSQGNLQLQCTLRVSAYLIYFKRDGMCNIHAMNKGNTEEHEISQTGGWFN